MNRNQIKALLLIGVLGSLTGIAHGQASTNPPPFPPFNFYDPNFGIGYTDYDWVFLCLDPTSTSSPYSTDYDTRGDYDSMFGAVIGISGTANLSKVCWGPSGVTLPVAGRLGFYIGTDPDQTNIDGTHNDNFGKGGSLQDNLQLLNQVPPSAVDDGMTLTYGGYSGVGGNCSVANIVQSTTTTTNGVSAITIKKEQFGKNAIDTFYWGLSNRYMVAESTISLGARVQLQMDILGDTCKATWKIQNTMTATNIGLGLWFGQFVAMNGIQGGHSPDYITIPGGRQPINSDTRFQLNPKPNQLVPENPLPQYVNFGLYQSWAYGLQVVLSPSTQLPDQTQADGMDLGKMGYGFLFDSPVATTGNMIDTLLPDTSMLDGFQGYIEKFEPILVSSYTGNAIGVGADTRTIVAYYRSTWSSGDYSKPYTVVLDAPPVVATTPGAPQTFQNAPFSLFIHIDNTLGFSQNQQEVPLEDVEVDLDLPAGMTDANNPGSNHMVQYVPIIPARRIANLRFQVAVDSKLFGNQQYTVTVLPNPGKPKTLSGQIVVASQPYLQLTGSANLVTAPWQFGSSDWATIIGANSGLVVDQDFQVFGWDATAQSYVLQTDPQRGYGSFIVANKNVGFVSLGGNPQQVQDIQTGAPQVILQPGWNLVANPYNYAIPLGQLVGVPEADNQNAYTFEELASQNYVSGSLAFWDPQSQGYEFTQSYGDLLQPNTGYWLYVTSVLPVTIEYMPVFQAFLPGLQDSVGDLPKQHVKSAPSAANSPVWTLQLAARSNGMVDGKTSIGQTTTPKLAQNLTKYKAPVAPVKNAISSYIVQSSGKHAINLAEALTPETVTNQTWTWNVFTQNAGQVTLTWPNMSSVPANVEIRLIDPKTGGQRNLRQTPSVTFAAGAQSVKTYELVVTAGPALPVIENVQAATGSATENVSYTLSVNANTTVTVNQNNQVIATLVNNRADQSGKSTTSWNFLDAANRTVKNGTYQVVVTSTPSGGQASTKSESFIVKR